MIPLGVHAFALTATAYARGLLLSYLEPRGGYQLYHESDTIFDGPQLVVDLYSSFHGHPYIFIFHRRDIHLCIYRTDTVENHHYVFVVYDGGHGLSFTF